MFATILKFLVVVGLLVAGGFFLAKGLGINIPLFKYNGLEAHNVPVGAVLLATAVAIARFWKISKTITYEETTTNKSGDGTTIRTTRIKTETTTIAESPSDRFRDKQL
jgi:hypothetical protein